MHLLRVITLLNVSNKSRHSFMNMIIISKSNMYYFAQIIKKESFQNKWTLYFYF